MKKWTKRVGATAPDDGGGVRLGVPRWAGRLAMRPVLGPLAPVAAVGAVLITMFVAAEDVRASLDCRTCSPSTAMWASTVPT